MNNQNPFNYWMQAGAILFLAAAAYVLGNLYPVL